jgi:hypothetical protein
MIAAAVRTILPGVLLCALLAGCNEGRSTDTESLSRCLPSWVKRHGVFEQELRKHGAYAKGGKLFAASGKKIYFYEHWRGGPPPLEDGGGGGVSFIGKTSDGKKRQTTELPELRRQYVLIEIPVNTP